MAEDISTEGRFEVARRPTLRHLTASRLRDAIHTGRLPPNERLNERDLCARTGVSRSSIREALQQLESEGLLRRSNKKGVFVAALTVEEARHIYQIRLALEPAMARLFAVNASEALIDQLQAALRDIIAAIADGESVAYAKAHALFFDTLVIGSGNQIAREILRTLESRITRLRVLTFSQSTPPHRTKSTELLSSIVEAATARDGDQIERKMISLIRRSAEFGEDVLRNIS